MIEVRVGLIGFGHVGQAFGQLLLNKLDTLQQIGIDLKLVGVATKSHGLALDPTGLPLPELLAARQDGHSLDPFHTGSPVATVPEFIQTITADILVESTLFNVETGQPAIDYIRQGLERGLHLITTNKSGPALAYRRLSQLARRQQRAFLFEGAVMDGAPIFSLVRDTLPLTEILGFRGVLNSTTNFILTSMEEGLPPEDALRQAQALGIAEQDSALDIDGWDAAAKTAILANALLDGELTPAAVVRTGIRHLTTRTVIEAARQGRRFKLVAEAFRREGGLMARVSPKLLPLHNPLAHVGGSATALTLSTDTLGELTLHLNEGETSQTAYAILADLATILKSYYRLKPAQTGLL